MPQYKHFKTSIRVDGRALPEYAVETKQEEDDRTMTCWIESKVGKRFSVHWRDTLRRSSTCGDVRVDGYFAGGSIIDKADNNGGRAFLSGMVLTASTSAPFHFGTITLTDDDSCLVEDEATTEKIGTIVLEILHGKVSRRRRATRDIEVQEQRPVHEKSKKAGSRRVTYPVIIQNDNPVYPFKINKACPIIRFIFNYTFKGDSPDIAALGRTDTKHLAEELQAKGLIRKRGRRSNAEPASIKEEVKDEKLLIKIEPLDEDIAHLRGV